MELVIVWVLGVSAATLFVFVVWYGRTSPWEDSPAGRHIMANSATLLVLLVLLILEFTWEAMPVRDAARLVVALFVLASCIDRVMLLSRVRREAFLKSSAKEAR